MAFNILQILESSGVKAKAVQVNDTFTNLDYQLNRTFLDTIRNATNRIDNTDCSDNIINNSIGKIGNYVENNLKFKNIISNVGLLGDYSKVDDSLVDLICNVINANFKTLTAFIESILKILINILRKIEKMKTKVDTAIKDFSKELRNCLIRIVIDAKVGTEKIIRETLSTDLILDLMIQCDCIMDIIRENFTLCKDLTTPQQIALCLRTEYALSPEQLINELNKWTKNNLTDKIESGFNAIDDMMSTFLNTIIKPFRAIVKEYCKELNKKRNVNFLLLKDPSIRCLFQYSEEYDSNGNKFFGMSIIDMIESMKIWSTCIDSVCSTLHDDIRRKIQYYNQELKLEFKYWNSEVTTDLYFACIAPSSEISRVRSTTIREIYRKNSGKGKFIELIDFYKSIGKVLLEDEVEAPPVFGVSVAKILDKIDSDEEEIKSGNELFKPGIEKLLIKIYDNLGEEIHNRVYYDKIQELSTWDYKFKKSTAYINKRIELHKEHINPTKQEAIQTVATSQTNLSDRVKDDEYYSSPETPPMNEYSIDDDYTEVSFNKPEKRDGESLSSFYKRWWGN